MTTKHAAMLARLPIHIHQHIPPVHYFIAAPVEFALVTLIMGAGVVLLVRNVQFNTADRPAMEFMPMMLIARIRGALLKISSVRGTVRAGKVRVRAV
jgi:hypothetical protein